MTEHSPEWQAGYESGYLDGESSMQADYDHALDPFLPADVDATSPRQLVNYICQLQQRLLDH